VIEAYGMTEASHQMASNPLPPGQRKPGSVGVAAGPEVAIMGEDGTFCPMARIGEIVIRGDNVTPATRTTPRPTPRTSPTAGSAPATRATWTTDGYLTITGRIKEIINRGGEKVSPREVDDVLMEHPPWPRS
jgi:oxalate---CoA ligase